VGRISVARVDTGDCGVRVGRSRRPLVRVAVAAVGLVLTLLATGCGGSDEHSPKAQATSEPTVAANVELPGGRIAFRRFLDDAQTHGSIFTINLDGRDERQLTDPPVGYVDDQPDWSPDGKRIAFERCAEGEPCQVFTVAADGGSPQKVEARCELGPVCDLANPAWTPDGRLVVTLAQGRERSDPTSDENWIQQSAVELLDLGNGRQRTIVERRDWTGDANTPAVSPDGRTVIYTRWNSWRSEPAGRQAIFAVNFDGSEQRRLTPWELGAGDHPVFSPDGGNEGNEQRGTHMPGVMNSEPTCSHGFACRELPDESPGINGGAVTTGEDQRRHDVPRAPLYRYRSGCSSRRRPRS
jgi:WD40-like Beta Propeller Repeat